MATVMGVARGGEAAPPAPQSSGIVQNPHYIQLHGSHKRGRKPSKSTLESPTVLMVEVVILLVGKSTFIA